MTELPPHWSSLALGELCSSVEKVDPANLGRDDFWYVDIGALEPSSSSLEKVINIPTANAPGRARQLIRNGDSIFATVRPYMKKVAYIPKEFDGQIASTGFCVLRPIQEKLHSKYLFYFLLSDQLLDQVLPLQRGVSYPAIRDNDLKNAHIPIPPIDEQNKIVELLEDHLSRLDAALADVKQAKLKAAQFRRSLLQAAFTGNISSGGVSPFTEWRTKTVGELADTQLGKMLNKGKQSGNYAKPYLRTDNVHWGRFDLSEIKEMDILPEEREKYLATKGDLLMCEGGASGRTAIWHEDYDISFQNHVHRIRPKDPKVISPKYLLYYFEWFIKNGYASELIKGVTISSLSQSGLRSIEVNFPLIEEQHKIVEHLEGLLSRLDESVSLAGAMEKQSNGLRRSLLQAAFTGQLTKEVISV